MNEDSIIVKNVKKRSENDTKAMMIQDVKSLYLNFAVYYAVLAVFYGVMRMWILCEMNVCGVVFFIVASVFRKRKKSYVSEAVWVFLMDLFVLANTLVSNRLLSCACGYTFLAFVIIPISLFYLYANPELSGHMRIIYFSVNILILIVVISCMVNFIPIDSAEERPLNEIQIHFVTIVNQVAGALALTVTSVRFAIMTFWSSRKMAQKNEELEYNMNHNSLTGILNMNGFSKQAKSFLRDHSDEKYNFILTDIYNFKLLNEIMGQESGDRILCEMAEWMQEKMTGSSLLGYMQADRFAMIVPASIDLETIYAEGYERFKQHYSTNAYHFHMYLGVYPITDTHESIRSMADKTLVAIQEVKGNLEQSLVYYTDNNLSRKKSKQELIANFDEAIEKKQFVMYLQPQTDADGKMYGSEALIRWQHPEKGLLFPGDFVEIFEEARLIHRLDQYIWTRAAELLQKWQEKGYPYYISVNVSTRDFYMLDVYEVFENIAEEYGIDRSKLRIEVTETVAAADEVGMFRTLERLRNVGFIIEIDDFGSGYSSLNYLKDLGADVLKIDRGFLAETNNTLKAKSILKMVIKLANEIGMRVITEGVEEEEQLNMLTDMGCQRFQGYYFSKPIDVESFEKKYNIS